MSDLPPGYMTPEELEADNARTLFSEAENDWMLRDRYGWAADVARRNGLVKPKPKPKVKRLLFSEKDLPFPWSDEYAASRMHMKPRAFRELCGKVERDTGLTVRRKAGRYYVLTERDWNTLMEAIACHSSSTNEETSGTCAAPSAASQLEKARSLVTGSSPRKSASSAKRKSSNVLYMEQPQRRASPKQS